MPKKEDSSSFFYCNNDRRCQWTFAQGRIRYRLLKQATWHKEQIWIPTSNSTLSPSWSSRYQHSKRWTAKAGGTLARGWSSFPLRVLEWRIPRRTSRSLLHHGPLQESWVRLCVVLSHQRKRLIQELIMWLCVSYWGYPTKALRHCQRFFCY